MKVLYEGFFFEPDDISRKCKATLAKKIAAPHITTKFYGSRNPVAPGHQNFLGMKIVVQVTGYGNNGKNEGYTVKLVEAENEYIKNIFDDVVSPHITTSVAVDGKPKDTANLNFVPVGEQEQTVLVGKYGFFCADQAIYYGKK